MMSRQRKVEMQEAAFHWLDVQMVALKDQIK
jgi:hypothetical protein